MIPFSSGSDCGQIRFCRLKQAVAALSAVVRHAAAGTAVSFHVHTLLFVIIASVSGACQSFTFQDRCC